jgi:hypothetical protein
MGEAIRGLIEARTEGEEMSPTVRGTYWTVEEDESLRALALTGESAAAISRRLEHPTAELNRL